MNRRTAAMVFTWTTRIPVFLLSGTWYAQAPRQGHLTYVGLSYCIVLYRGVVSSGRAIEGKVLKSLFLSPGKLINFHQTRSFQQGSQTQATRSLQYPRALSFQAQSPSYKASSSRRSPWHQINSHGVIMPFARGSRRIEIHSRKPRKINENQWKINCDKFVTIDCDKFVTIDLDVMDF